MNVHQRQLLKLLILTPSMMIYRIMFVSCHFTEQTRNATQVDFFTCWISEYVLEPRMIYDDSLYLHDGKPYIDINDTPYFLKSHSC